VKENLLGAGFGSTGFSLWILNFLNRKEKPQAEACATGPRLTI